MERSELIRQCQKKLHDINNKLSAITGYGSLLQDESNLSFEQKKNLETIVDTALIVGNHIQELYDILEKLE